MLQENVYTHNFLLSGMREKTHLCLAPMQGITHVYYRQLLEDIGGMDALYTEFFNSESISENSKRLNIEICRVGSKLPLVVQLIGADVQSIRKAAHVLYQKGVRHFNLNAGCPYGRLSQRLAGGKMMKHPEVLNEIVDVMDEWKDITFSVKIRNGYDTCNDFQNILPALLKPWVSFVIIHCRLVKDGYRYPADWDRGQEMIQMLAPKPVVMNGDIFDVESALRVFSESKANGIMLGRGAIRNPWLFKAIKLKMQGVMPAFWVYPQDVFHFYTQFKDMLNIKTDSKNTLGPLKEIIAHMADLIDETGSLLYALKRASDTKEFEGLMFKALETWPGVRLF